MIFKLWQIYYFERLTVGAFWVWFIDCHTYLIKMRLAVGEVRSGVYGILCFTAQISFCKLETILKQSKRKLSLWPLSVPRGTAPLLTFVAFSSTPQSQSCSPFHPACSCTICTFLGICPRHLKRTLCTCCLCACHTSVLVSSMEYARCWRCGDLPRTAALMGLREHCVL